MLTTSRCHARGVAGGKDWPTVLGWLPLVGLVGVIAATGATWPAWQMMCGLAVSIFVGLKWLTFVDFVGGTSYRRRAALTTKRIAAYMLLWPGMDPRPFFAHSPIAEPPPASEWGAAVSKIIVGVAVVVLAVELAANRTGDARIAAGALGLVGMLLVFHFGLFHVLALAWRRCGVAANPIMNAPLLATSLGRFWSERWNLAFRDLAHRFVFRPTIRQVGPAAATMLVFLVSGAIHDIVISVPVRAGYGLPTLYFVIQGVGLLIERSKTARRMGIGRGAIGWTYCLAFTLGPIALLFHRPFVEQAIVPMLLALRSLI